MKMEQVYGELELAKSEIEKLKFTVSEKESMIQHLSCANTKLRKDSEATLSNLEQEKSRLLKALDEADEKNKGQEKEIGALKSEAENIRAALFASHNKCSEAEQEAKALKEARRKEDESVRLEDVKRKLEDQLKWKKEQFELLEQAHEKLRAEFKRRKREWEVERSSLLEEMSKLQSTLDSQTSRAESFKTRLDNCKQALVHEESRRRNLESRVSEMKTRLECVSDESWEAAKSRASTAQTDDQISSLRDSLREKESEVKEAEYRARKLEMENQDLLNSLRELQEAHIPKAATSTPPSAVAKVKSKLRSLEHAHKECSANLRSKEAEWDSQMRIMRKDLDEHKFCLKIKEASIKDLKKDLDECNVTNTELKMQNEELSLMLQLLRTEFSGTQSVTPSQQNEDNETHKYKEMVDASYREQASLKQEVQELCCALERLNCELAEKADIEFELQMWILTAERLQAKLEENQRLRGELELSLLAQAGFEEELKLDICNLKQQFGLPEYEDETTPQMEEEDKWPNQEEENTVNIFNVGKERESVERSPFREIN